MRLGLGSEVQWHEKVRQDFLEGLKQTLLLLANSLRWAITVWEFLPKTPESSLYLLRTLLLSGYFHQRLYYKMGSDHQLLKETL